MPFKKNLMPAFHKGTKVPLKPPFSDYEFEKKHYRILYNILFTLV
jgi:hypothetical protein